MGFSISREQMDTFLRVLDPSDNSTGGGSASAIAGAMAAELVAMVARLSIQADDDKAHDLLLQIARESSTLSEKLLAGADEDARAFDAVMRAYRQPKGNDQELAARREAIQSAMITATRIPLDNATHCTHALHLATQLQDHANPRALSDLQCAFFLARAGLHGCLANVQINLPGIKDPQVATELRDQMEKLQAA